MEEFVNKDLFVRTRNASSCLLKVGDEIISGALCALADSILSSEEKILEANKEDLSRMDPADPKYDRLALSHGRLVGIADGIKAVASLPSPLGKTLSSTVRPNGLKIERVSYPFGVVGIIYEARP
ncbi:MAG: gamma-glutamyl-phosphate reductase, partial [Bacteroidales bacterium]|nr:gamma-glutamyl-phosphate reductase [Bacteroidales bacterium]